MDYAGLSFLDNAAGQLAGDHGIALLQLFDFRPQVGSDDFTQLFSA